MTSTESRASAATRRRLVGVGRIVAQQMPVRLDDDPASAGADDDRLDALLDMRPPGVDVGARVIERLVVCAQVIAQCAAAAGTRSPDQRDVDPIERARERRIDAGRQRRLHAAREQQHPPRMARLRPSFGGARCGNPGGERARQQRPRDAAGGKCQTEPVAMGKPLAQQPTAHALAGRTLDSLLGDAVSDIEQPPEADARRAGRFATAAAETTVEVQRGGGGDRIAFEHLLDQVDAPAGAVEFVAQQLIRRAGRRAEAAMHAGAQYRFRVASVGGVTDEVGQMGFHPVSCQSSVYIRPGLKMPAGSSAAFTR